MKDIRMSVKETRQISTFDRLKRKEITQKEAEVLLSLSERQIRRKIKRYVDEGVVGLIHKSRGRSSNRRIPDEQRAEIIYLYKKFYSDFGPTLASEKLFERHGIKINPETLRLLLIENNLWIVKRKRSKHRKWRERKEHFGEMIQVDGSMHDWCEGRGPKCCLIAFIDDATNTVWCKFAKNESYESVMPTTIDFCKKYGKPVSIYSDRGCVFKVNVNNEENEHKTQYERALRELGIQIIHARSPQAKGRVERLFGTLQDRLVRELRLDNISNIDDANKFLNNKFIDEYNRKFAKLPAKKASFFRKISEQELTSALCIKSTRKLRNDFTIRYNNKILQLSEKQKTILRPKETIKICEYWNGKIELYVRNTRLRFKTVAKEETKKNISVKETNYVKTKETWVPPKNHPWRKSNSLFFK